MRSGTFIVVFLLLIAPAQKSDIKLEIGSRLNSKYAKHPDGSIITHPAQTRPYIERGINGVRYLIAFDQKSRRVTYIHTKDEKFSTVEGLKIGVSINVTAEQVVVYPGWEIRGPMTKDGWYPIIGFDFGDFNPIAPESFKNQKTISVQIKSFSKGGN